MNDTGLRFGFVTDGPDTAHARVSLSAQDRQSARDCRCAVTRGSRPQQACRGPAVATGPVVALTIVALLGMGASADAREAPVDDAVARCRDADEALDRVSACTRVLNGTRDKSKLGQAYNRRGHANVELENFEAAARDFAEVARLNPTVGGYQDNRAKALRLGGRLTEALDAADAAVRLAPGHAFVLRGRALVHEEMGRLDLAIIDINRGMEIDPRDPGLRTDRGQL